MILFSVKFGFVLTQPLIFFLLQTWSNLTSFCAFTRLSEKSFNTVQDKGKLFVPGVNFIVEKVSFYNMITTDFLRNKHDPKLFRTHKM